MVVVSCSQVDLAGSATEHEGIGRSAMSSDFVAYFHKKRCEGKHAFTRAAAADREAQRASLRTRELIISYKCCDCGKWHLGHADEAQMLSRVQGIERHDARTHRFGSCIICGDQTPQARFDLARKYGKLPSTLSPKEEEPRAEVSRVFSNMRNSVITTLRTA
jgi:hypothetical protein